jgi:hypothetical protein
MRFMATLQFLCSKLSPRARARTYIEPPMQGKELA